MSHAVDFTEVSTTGLESSPVAEAWVHGILQTERDITIASMPLEASLCDVDGIVWAHVFYESGLAVNVLYTRADGGKRAVGFKLSEGMKPPAELATFKWVRQKSKLAGTLRGTYFVVKGSYDVP
jgi:hypothetical protein